MPFQVPFLSAFSRSGSARSREIVLEILKASPTPLKSQVIFQRVRSDYANEKIPTPAPSETIQDPQNGPASSNIPQPPFPDHPIRSLKYLKTVVLEDLVARHEIEKVHSMREPTAEELQHAKERSKKKSKKNKANNVPPVVINVRGMIDQWEWTLKTPEKRNKDKEEKKRIAKAVEGQRLLDTKRVEKDRRNEFLDEWGHLNPRRQRARVGKLEREEKWANILESSRLEGITQARQKPS